MSLITMIAPRPSPWVRFGRPLLIAAVAVLGLAAGAAKWLETPEEVQFFARASVAPEALAMFGAIQFFAALLLLLPRTRAAAGLILAACFATSAWLIWTNGQAVLALVAGAPVALTLIAAFWRKPRG
ncbi:MAG: hypothetical protein LJE68_01210 [Rhodobacter sp.]|nr:hypothetical protein [Rhodobacter sp.]